MKGDGLEEFKAAMDLIEDSKQTTPEVPEELSPDPLEESVSEKSISVTDSSSDMDKFDFKFDKDSITV